ncbi:MAG: C39 family peptidase [Alphaproteobacteria bacterium]|nr:C39 family peptidase [Alphaproteobacteria bacterium]
MPQKREVRLAVPRFIQPDEVTCGPSSLLSVLRYLGVDGAGLDDVIAATPRNPDGGTLAPHLGRAAQAFGHRSRIRPLAVKVFDPTWWNLPQAEVRDRLRRRTHALPEGALRRVHEAWLAYLEQGGEVVLGELRTHHLTEALDRGTPLICGLSVTWLYQHPREMPDDNRPDDIHGSPVGHFVVVTGYADGGDVFFVSDPWPHPPFEGDSTETYAVGRRRLHQAILLGDATHDAVVMEVFPPEGAP